MVRGESKPVTLGFLARLIGLGGISEEIKAIIKKIRRPIDKALNKVVGFVVGKVKKIGGRLMGRGRGNDNNNNNEPSDNGEELKDNVVDWNKKQIPFTTVDGGSHNIKFKLSGSNVKVMVYSTPLPIETLLRNELKEAGDSGNNQAKAKAEAALNYYSDDVLPLIDEIERLEIKRDSQAGAERTSTTNKIKSKENALKTPLQILGEKLSKLNLDEESGQAVPSNVKAISNGVEANPLTY